MPVMARKSYSRSWRNSRDPTAECRAATGQVGPVTIGVHTTPEDFAKYIVGSFALGATARRGNRLKDVCCAFPTSTKEKSRRDTQRRLGNKSVMWESLRSEQRVRATERVRAASRSSVTHGWLSFLGVDILRLLRRRPDDDSRSNKLRFSVFSCVCVHMDPLSNNIWPAQRMTADTPKTQILYMRRHRLQRVRTH
ncbi:unnamed protein product [Ectocarpus sp. 12 AP-2014]